MSFFDDDGIDDIVNQFFGNGNVKRRQYRKAISEEDERTIDFIENDKYAFVIFELPGYESDDVKVSISENNLLVSAKKREVESVKEYLASKLSQGVSFEKELPEDIDEKDFDYSMVNGILEIKFGRKK